MTDTPKRRTNAYSLSNFDSVTLGSTETLNLARTQELRPYPDLQPFTGATSTSTNRSELPSFWSSQAPRPSTWRLKLQGIFKGWRLIIFNSWLNLLLVLIPISWALDLTAHKSHSVIFALCALSLIPLVKLHELSTKELSIRIGGSKTGLLNASMGNLVEIVLAISALRRCELRVVQSALVGSILSKLLLVLGLCFFAGGMRFSEQGFDATATQMHSSLLSISVGAVLLPAAYHFTLDAKRATPEQQAKNILRMSYGVSIILLFIYSAYLVFQLWSHTHLYHDEHNKKSRRLSLHRKVPKEIKTAGKRIAASMSTLDLSKTISRATTILDSSPSRSYTRPPLCACKSSTNADFRSEILDNEVGNQAGTSTFQLVNQSSAKHMTREDTLMSSDSCDTTVLAGTGLPDEDPQEGPVPGDHKPETKTPPHAPEARLSWTLTLSLLLIVTIVVAITAERLVGSMDGISSTIGKEWVGLILLPSVSVVAECITAINVSVRDELTLSVSVAVGSSIQTALFVFPFMVTLAWATHKPLSLLLDPFQSLVLYLSVQIMSYVVADGKSNWLEGVILISLYVIIAVSFWFYPGSNVPDLLNTCSI